MDNNKKESSKANEKMPLKTPKLILNEDYYLENGLFVLTAAFLLRRGYCCGSGCRHCPYKNAAE